MSDRRTSNYRGFRVLVEVTVGNEVLSAVRNADGETIFRTLVEDAFFKQHRPEALVAKAWKVGKRYVDTQLSLQEALKASPEWEIR